MSIDFAAIARDLKQSTQNIESAVNLLDAGNTISFITRFRKDQTGGLNEEQLLEIKSTVSRLRALNERKSFVSKSIESQGQMTPEIAAKIETADTIRQIEDIYLPFKPKKQTLATAARQNGLEPLATDILEGREPEKELAIRATDFVRVDKNLCSVDDVIAGVGHILAEQFSEDAALRDELRKIVAKGNLATRLIELPQAETESATAETPADVASESATVADLRGTGTADSLDDASAVDPVENDDGNLKESGPAVAAEHPQTTAGASTSLDTPRPKKRKKKKKAKEDNPFKEFADFSHPIAKMPYYKMLAINRGEKKGLVKVRILFDEKEVLNRAVAKLVPADHPFRQFMSDCVKDAMTRLVSPSIEREIRREITEAAEKHAVLVFARNLRNLLLQSPVRGHRVLAIDPGYKRGCSVVLLDCNGQLLHHDHIFVVGNEQRVLSGKQKLVELARNHLATLIAIGNGAACREAEQIVSDLINENSGIDLRYAIVNEAGASFYSTSEVGREEFPHLSPAVRSAVSIGRRLIDPLSELVKISPANIGVGLYQHDVRAKHLADSLDDVVEFCVNRVGVDVNTASPSLLRYVSGLNQLTARRLVETRQANGPFKNREQLKKVAGFGEATFVQAAGFLRIYDGDQPFDSTAIHPECYPVAAQIVNRVGGSIKELFPRADQPASSQMFSQAIDTTNQAADAAAVEENAIVPAVPQPSAIGILSVDREPFESPQLTAAQAVENNPTSAGPFVGSAELTAEQIARRNDLVTAIRKLDPDKLAAEMQIGQLLMRDILHSICRPQYDPRNNINRPIFRSGIVKIDDLKPDMVLEAQVVNVVDFGVFVDIGLGTSCLVHVSQLASHFIRDPHRLYAVGDTMKVWVSEVHRENRRVKLTAVQPVHLKPKKVERPPTPYPQRQPEHQRPKHSPPKGPVGKGKQKQHSARTNRPTSRPAKPKPVKPITEGMLSGSEPMRSFSDLAQFFTKRPEGDQKPMDK